MAKFVSSRAARVQLDKTGQAVQQQIDLLLKMGVTVNDHAEHITALEDKLAEFEAERERSKSRLARLRWWVTGR